MKEYGRMNRYTVEVPFSGYSRGFLTYEVVAESEAEALENVNAGAGVVVQDEVVRDDRKMEWEEATAQIELPL